MLKGLAITPPTVGRISIGRVVEKNGKRLPEKDDQFTLTTQVQNHDGWVLHPYDEALRKASSGKLRTLPVRMLFNDPDLNLRAEYSYFDREDGRPICMGDGELLDCQAFRSDRGPRRADGHDAGTIGHDIGIVGHVAGISGHVKTETSVILPE